MSQLLIGFILVVGISTCCGIRLLSICLYPSRYEKMD